MEQSYNLDSTSDMQMMLGKLKTIHGDQIDKKNIYVYIFGLKLLKDGFERKEAEPELLLEWFDAYLNLSNLIPPNDHQLNHKYAKTIPPAVIYVISCLSYKVFSVPNFHYHMLKKLYDLLTSVMPTILEKIIQQPDVIFYLWHIVKFVGDYPTQLLCLRLMKMLLQLLSAEQYQKVMQNIESSGYAELSGLMQLQSYEILMFDNYCRQFLNNYNFHAKEKNMVYSFCCEAIAVGDQMHFYKIFNVDKFWIDLNYRSGSLTFEGRVKTSRFMPYKNMKIRLNISEIAFKEQVIEVRFEPPIQALDGSYNNIKRCDKNIAKIYVSNEEYKMLLADKELLNKFNKNSEANIQNDNKTVTPFKIPYFDVSENKHRSSPLQQNEVISDARNTAEKERDASPNSKNYNLHDSNKKRRNASKTGTNNIHTQAKQSKYCKKEEFKQMPTQRRPPMRRKRKFSVDSTIIVSNLETSCGEKSPEHDSSDGDWFKMRNRGSKRTRQRKKKPSVNAASKSSSTTNSSKRQIQKVFPLSKVPASNHVNDCTQSEECIIDTNSSKQSLSQMPSVETLINVTNYAQLATHSDGNAATSSRNQATVGQIIQKPEDNLFTNNSNGETNNEPLEEINEPLAITNDMNADQTSAKQLAENLNIPMVTSNISNYVTADVPLVEQPEDPTHTSTNTNDHNITTNIVTDGEVIEVIDIVEDTNDIAINSSRADNISAIRKEALSDPIINLNEISSDINELVNKEPSNECVNKIKRPDTPVPSTYRFFSTHRMGRTSTQIRESLTNSKLNTIAEEFSERKNENDKENVYELSSDESDGPSTSYAAATRRHQRKRKRSETLNEIFVSICNDKRPNTTEPLEPLN